MKTRRFDFNWKPLQLQVSFAVEGSVPDRQTYNADTREYEPDYTLTPVVIQPCVSILDKDDTLPAGSVNHQLTNIRWYEIIGGVKRLIDTSDTGYEITTGTGEAGRIRVKKNVQPRNPLTLVFYAEYIDTRNSQLITVQGSYLLDCTSASDLIRVELDTAAQTIYNPLEDVDEQTVTASVWVGDRRCPPGKYALVWEVQDEDSEWHTCGSDAVMDYDVTVADGGGSLTVNRRLMGTELHVRCRCKYSADGNPASVGLTEGTPQAEAVFVRRIPRYEYDYTGVPYNIPSGLMELSPTAVVQTTKGDVPNFEAELLPLWYVATNKASGTLSYSQVAHGQSPIIPTKAMDSNYGAVIGLDVRDRGHWGAWTDATDGAVICDADGDIMLLH